MIETQLYPEKFDDLVNFAFNNSLTNLLDNSV